MQTSSFDAGYPHPLQHHHQGGAVYSSMAGFDSAGLKFHPGGYPETATDAAAFYQNYVNGGGVVSTQDYAPREPPSYAESTSPTSSSGLFHHPGFGHYTSATDYYKVGAVSNGVNGQSLRPMDMVGDYAGLVRPSAVADNFLMKQEVGGGGSCGDSVGGVGHSLMDYNNAARYSEETLHQLQQQQQQQQQHQHGHQHHHHQHSHHQHQHQQQQHPQSHPQLQHPQVHQHHNPEAPMQMPGELRPEDCKTEPESQQDFKASNDLALPPTADMGNLQQQQQHPHGQEELRDLPTQVPIATDAATEHQQPTQSPGSEDALKALKDGADVTSGGQDVDSGTPGLASGTPLPQQEGGSAGEESGKGSANDANNSSSSSSSSNEVKPTLSYIALIAKSILESPHRRLNLGSIYGWIEKNFPYYKNRGQGWRNSVRHNLSLNDCFIKAGRCEDGKGNYWAIHPANMQDFLRGDFRQRRRSRRRGRKKDCELGMYAQPLHPHHHPHHQFNGYLGAATASGVAAAAAAAAGVGGFPGGSAAAASLSNLYSPYTEAERRAYRLDEALLRQSINNPFLKWYHQPGGAYPPPPTTSPSPATSAVYSGVAGVAGVTGVTGVNSPTAAQWPQTYPDNSGQGVYPLNSSFSRNYTTPAIV